MRIKLFENFKKQYEEIDEDDYCEIVYRTNSGKFLHLTPYEKKMIESIFPNHQVQYGKWLVWKSSCIIPNFLYGKSIYIDKFDDDWFLVAVPKNHYDERYYKCDQFEGLLELLHKVTGKKSL